MSRSNPLTLLSTIVAAFLISSGSAADLTFLPNQVVQVSVDGTASQRIAVDISSNLIHWAQVATAAPNSGRISFLNDISLADPARFFRLADSDATFSISGFVDGGDFLGGLSGATIVLSDGTTTQSDTNGFFHFDQRFPRSILPLQLRVSSTMFPPVYRTIAASEAGTFSIIRVLSGLPALPPWVDGATVRFQVKSGPRAGEEFSITVTNQNHFIAVGLVTGSGSYSSNFSPKHLRFTFDAGPADAAPSDIYFYANFSALQGVFAGIPSPTGTLAGNGEFTIELPKVNFAPETLVGHAYTLDSGQFEFNDTTYSLTTAVSSEAGFYHATLAENTWTVTMENLQGITVSVLNLTFTDREGGTYTLERPGNPVMSGTFSRVLVEPGLFPAPATITTLHIQSSATSGIGAQAFTVNLSGGTTGTFSITSDIGENFGSGSYTYTPLSTSAHLLMNYSTQFQGDYDDIILTFKGNAGSSAPSTFSGTQRVSNTVYQYSGTFTY
jgi:hypothetical protein